MIQRLEPVIIEIERERECVCIVAHQAVLRALYGYFNKVPLAVRAGRSAEARGAVRCGAVQGSCTSPLCSLQRGWPQCRGTLPAWVCCSAVCGSRNFSSRPCTPVPRSSPRPPDCLQDIPRLEIPLHTLIELTPKPDGKMAEDRLKIDIHDPSMQHLLKGLPSDMRPRHTMPMTPFSPLDHLRADPFGSGAMSRKSSGGLSNVSGHTSCRAADCHGPGARVCGTQQHESAWGSPCCMPASRLCTVLVSLDFQRPGCWGLSSTSWQASCSARASYGTGADSCRGSRGLSALEAASAERCMQGSNRLSAMLLPTSSLDPVRAESQAPEGQFEQ